VRSPYQYLAGILASRGGGDDRPLLRRQEYAFPLKFTPAVMNRCVHLKREVSISLPCQRIACDFRSQSETLGLK
jgi:hypothetical protein